MDPTKKFTMMRNVMKAVEARDEAVIKAERECVIQLRQLLDQALAADAPVQEPQP